MSNKKPSPQNKKQPKSTASAKYPAETQEKEIGGFKDSGLKEPTRYGDWEVKGRCSDF